MALIRTNQLYWENAFFAQVSKGNLYYSHLISAMPITYGFHYSSLVFSN